jgi:hypothetical protein
MRTSILTTVTVIVYVQAGPVPATGHWTAPQPFTPANSGNNDAWIAFSQDYLSFYIATDGTGISLTPRSTARRESPRVRPGARPRP